jgi:acetylornithine/succinyldiaminopimelate/putrescine aminotransferase
METFAHLSPTYSAAAQGTIELLQRMNAEKRCTFFTSSNYMHAETAKLGYLLSSLRSKEGAAGDCRTYFVNSTLEALSSALKLARQTSVRHQRYDGGWILVVDEQQRFQPFFDATRRGPESGLTPHVTFVDSVAEARIRVGRRLWSALIVVRDTGLASDAALAALVTAARNAGTMIVSCDSELSLSDTSFAAHGFDPDVVVYGENLTDRQLPFGCFTMTEQAHAVWNNDVDCFAQTSTFGGNRACAAVALAALEAHGLVTDADREVFRKLDSNFAAMLQYWGKHVNPGMAALAGIAGLDLNISQAYGGRLRLADGREIIDCSGGFGSNLRGHNPSDVPQALASHDPDHDYFADVEKLLRGVTKFAHAFPAVSGASAVDIAVTLGLLANPQRRKIVTFMGNFSGKTMFALNLSKHGPQLTESDDDAFRPYYPHLVYIDPFSAKAEKELRSVLSSGEVALIWFEAIRGGMCEMLPPKLLEIIAEMKHAHGYLIGVDEVLTGGWRGGPDYLAHASMLRDSDIVTVGKTLSDMTLPMAAVLVTAEVYARAGHSNAAHLARLERHYRNNLAAHVCVNGLTRVLDPEKRLAFRKAEAIVEHGLRELVTGSKVFGRVDGRGTLLLLVLNRKYFPFHHRSKLGNLLELAASHLIFERCGVFVFLLRVLHRVCTDEADARELVRRLRNGLADVTPSMIYRYALSRILSQRFPELARRIAGRATRTKDGVSPQVGY